MAASESTKFQINYRLNDGTLINLYAASVQELESGLADIAMNASNIKATAVELGGTPAPAGNIANIAAAFNATSVEPAAVQANGAAHQCRHGLMGYREGTNAQGKAWKAYMCASAKGTPKAEQCDPIWVR